MKVFLFHVGLNAIMAHDFVRNVLNQHIWFASYIKE